jgi:hypothetical protein
MVWVNRVLLGMGALTALILASAILFLPGPFYAGYGIDPGGQVSLLNELKAPALVIMSLGVLQSIALFVPARLRLGLGAGLLLYLGFGLSRVVAMAIDGLPSAGLVLVALVELALGLAFGAALLWQRR